MINLVKKYWPILVIFIFSLTPLLWFKGDLIISGGDESILLDPGSLFKSVFYAWNGMFNGGNPVGDYQGNVAHLFPLVLFWFLLGKAGLSLVLIEKLWFISTWFVSGLGIYYLCLVIFKEKTKANLIALFAITLYLFNLYVMQYPLMYTVKLPIMIAPWTLALMIKGLETKHIKYAILFGLVSLLGASSWVNPPSAFIILSLPFLYLIFYTITNRNFIKPLFFFLKATFFFLLFNFYWILPFATNLLQSASGIKQNEGAFFFDTTSLFDPLRFLGGWFFREFSNTLPYFPLNSIYYDSSFFVVVSYILIIIAFGGYLFVSKIKEDKILLYFLFTAIISLFLVKGSQSPFEELNIFLYKYIPNFWIFREPYSKFMPMVVLSISIMFGFSFYSIIDYLRSKLNNTQRLFVKITIIIGVILTIIVSYPLVLGKSIWNYYDGPARPYYAKIPNYWLETKDWLETNDPNATILTLPKTNKGSTTYDWENGFTIKGSVAQHVLPNPYFYYQYKPMYKSEIVSKGIYDKLVSQQSQFLAKELGFFGLKYILVQKDINTDYVDDSFISYPGNIDNLLSNRDGLEKVFSRDKLDLWKVDDNLLIEKIFSNKQPVYLTSSKIQKQIFPLREVMNIENEDNLIISKTNSSQIPSDIVEVKSFSLLDSEYFKSGNKVLFKLIIDNKADYQLFFKTNELTNINKIYLDDQLVDENLVKAVKISEEDHWLSVDLKQLNEGEHTIYVNPIDSYIQINDSSFESMDQLELEKPNDSWELVDASRDEGGEFQFEAISNDDAHEGEKSLLIKGKGHTAGIRQKIKLQKGKDYLLTFYYKNFDNQEFSYSIEYLNNKNGKQSGVGGFGDSLSISYDWKKHQTFFHAESDDAYIYFYARGIKQEQIVGVDSINLGQINVDPDSFFIKEVGENNDILQNLNFNKINPTKYIVDVDNTNEPFYLNFMELYNANWKVYYQKKNEKSFLWKNWFKKPIVDENNHYLLNGFANSWRIDKSGDYQIVIEYKPQNVQTFIYLLSLFSILINILYLIVKVRKKT